MGKSNGGTRTGNSGSPRGLSQAEQNVISVNNRIISEPAIATTRSTAINMEDVANSAINTLNDLEAFYGNPVQLSKTEGGNRAIRIFMDGPSSVRYQNQNREINRIAEDLRRRYNYNIRTSVDNIRGRRVGYIEFVGWK